MSNEKPRSPKPAAPRPDEVIRIEDLAPREDVKGGRKIVLGEVSGEHGPFTPASDAISG